MKKYGAIFIVMTMTVLIMSAHAFAADDNSWDGPGGEEEDAEFIEYRYFKTTIENVKYTTPDAGSPCTVSADIKIDKFYYEYYNREQPPALTSVLVYRVNGGTSKEIPMANATDSLWTASIPSSKSGDRVEFYIKAIDSYGLATGAFPSAENLVQAAPDIDNSADIVPDDLDLLGFAAGYDSENIYVRFNVQGKITGGTVNPPYIHIYGIKFSEPGTDSNGFLMTGILWAYIPLIKQDYHAFDGFTQLLSNQKDKDKLQAGVLDNLKETGQLVLDINKLLSGNIAEGFLLSSKPKFEVKGNTFEGSIKRPLLGGIPSGVIHIVCITAANASMDSFMPIPLNLSHYISLYLNDFEYTVK